MFFAWIFVCLMGVVYGACPYMEDDANQNPSLNSLHFRADGANPSDQLTSSNNFLDQFTLDDSNSFLTSDVGVPIQDDISLKAGDRGPTLLEDFILRQKITHFDHERVSLSFTLYL
jgi:catalase